MILSWSPAPTLEDVRSWTVSFEKVMKSAAGRGCFRQFLRTEFSEENMMFWLACEDLKKETNKTVVEEKVRQIYEDFISILSPKEVSRWSRAFYKEDIRDGHLAASWCAFHWHFWFVFTLTSGILTSCWVVAFLGAVNLWTLGRETQYQLSALPIFSRSVWIPASERW